MPDPATITDWDTERTFRITSFNGQAHDYTYLVIKDEIRSKGNVELKTPAEIVSFAATRTSIIKGDLVIGSDSDNAEEIKDISALGMLKEIEGFGQHYQNRRLVDWFGGEPGCERNAGDGLHDQIERGNGQYPCVQQWSKIRSI